MIVLDNGDALRGVASVASKIDYTVNGYVGTTATQLADGQLGAAEADLYLSGADAIVVTSITLVNTDTAARTVDLFVKPSAGTSRRIIPKTLSLGIGHSLYTDGQRITVMDASGQMLSTWAVDDTPVNGETDKPISSNWAYDHNAAKTGVHQAGANNLATDNDIATHAALTATHGVAGAIVGTSDTQELTNKTLTSPNVNEAVALGATATELNLLDLAGLTAGEVLVATGAAAAAWQSTGVKLSAPDISGVVTAASLLTWPALTLGGTVALNGQVFDAGAGDAQFISTGSTKGIYVSLTHNASVGVRFTAIHNSVTPAVNDKVLRLEAVGKDLQTPQNVLNYGKLEFQIEDATADHADGKLSISLLSDQAINEAIKCSGAGALWSDLSMDTLTYKVSGTQVMGAQGAAVADATDPASTQARLNDLLGRLRTHGLIAT